MRLLPCGKIQRNGLLRVSVARSPVVPPAQRHHAARMWHSGRPVCRTDAVVPAGVILLAPGHGPSAYLCPADAAPLKRELAAALGNTELTLCADEGEA